MYYKRGFTLIEILTSIAIIAILMGLLVPALSRASATGRKLECQSNLRQLFTMAENYSLRSDGRYPLGVRYENRSEFTTIAWDFKQTASGEISLGPLWKHVIEPGRVQQCPENHTKSTFGADPYTGYNYNTTFIAGEAVFPRTGWASVRRGLPRLLWRKLETTALFGDGGWKGGSNKFMRAPMNTIEGDLQVIYAGGQAFRHGGKTNVCWLDGHTSSQGKVYEGELATPPLLKDIMDFPENGFLSNDDSAYDPR